MTKRASMLAVAELYARNDAITEELEKIEAELRRLASARQSLLDESGHITKGIEAIGTACGLFAAS